MISFKNFLTEARMAPLYHATNMSRASDIISSNTLRQNAQDDNNKSISFTRLFKTAWQFGVRVVASSYSDIVVFEVDQQRLNQDYKLTPYQFWSQPFLDHLTRINKARLSKADESPKDGTFNEFEERVVDRDIINFMKYVTKIIVYSSSSFQKEDTRKRFEDTGKLHYWTQLPKNKYHK